MSDTRLGLPMQGHPVVQQFTPGPDAPSAAPASWEFARRYHAERLRRRIILWAFEPKVREVVRGE